MSTTLTKEDIQNLVTRIGESFSIERAKDLIAQGRFQGKSPEEVIILSANMMTDKNGIEKFVFVIDGLGTLIMSQDINGIYQVEKMEGKHQSTLCVMFQTAVKFYIDKDWGEDLMKA